MNKGSLPDEHKVSKKSADHRSVTLHEHGAEEPSTVEDNVNGGVHAQDDVKQKLAEKMGNSVREFELRGRSSGSPAIFASWSAAGATRDGR